MFALAPWDIALQQLFLFSRKIIYSNTVKEPRLFIYAMFFYNSIT